MSTAAEAGARDQRRISILEMLAALKIDEGKQQKWCESARRAFDRMDQDRKLQGNGLLYSERMKRFLMDDSSNVFIVNGRDRFYDPEDHYSAMSAPTITIADWLADNTPTEVVLFSCSSKMRKDRTLPGLLNKILRLVVYRSMKTMAETTQVAPSMDIREIKKTSTLEMCISMYNAIEHAVTERDFIDERQKLDITILVEGPDRLERESGADDFNRFIEHLNGIVELLKNKGRGDVFKVMLLYPNSGERARRHVPDARIVDIGPKHFKCADQDRLTHARIDLDDIWVYNGRSYFR